MENCIHIIQSLWLITLFSSLIFQGVHFVTSQHFWTKTSLCSVAQILAAERLVCVPACTYVCVCYYLIKMTLCSDGSITLSVLRSLLSLVPKRSLGGATSSWKGSLVCGLKRMNHVCGCETNGIFYWQSSPCWN